MIKIDELRKNPIVGKAELQAAMDRDVVSLASASLSALSTAISGLESREQRLPRAIETQVTSLLRAHALLEMIVKELSSKFSVVNAGTNGKGNLPETALAKLEKIGHRSRGVEIVTFLYSRITAGERLPTVVEVATHVCMHRSTAYRIRDKMIESGMLKEVPGLFGQPVDQLAEFFQTARTT